MNRFTHLCLGARASRGARAACLLILLSSVPALAASDDYVGPTPPRLSLAEGDVGFWAAGGDGWEEAPINLPLASGDVLSVGDHGRLEIQVGGYSFLRAAANTELVVETVDDRGVRFRVDRGRVALDVRRGDADRDYEIVTPAGTLTLQRGTGLYDIRVLADRAWFSAFDGTGASVRTPAGAFAIAPGDEVVAGNAFAQPVRAVAPAADGWIQWVRERSDLLLGASSRTYVGDGIYGARELDDFGEWHQEPDYGPVWVPTTVASGWAPYTTGRWVDRGVYGWTWVDAQPWGWAPFHYGRWVRWRSRWAWAPGPVVVRPVYSPALVAFLSPPVGVVVGVDPLVAWVALGWGEPVVPWWGPSWYRGRPCWTGWGGPTIINEVHVHRDRWRHGRDHIRHYRHQDTPDAISVVHRRDFDRPRASRVRLDPDQRRRFRPGGDLVPASVRPHGRDERRDDRGRTAPARSYRDTPREDWRRDTPRGELRQNGPGNRPRPGSARVEPGRDVGAPRQRPGASDDVRQRRMPAPDGARDRWRTVDAPRGTVPYRRPDRTVGENGGESRSPFDRRDRMQRPPQRDDGGTRERRALPRTDVPRSAQADRSAVAPPRSAPPASFYRQRREDIRSQPARPQRPERVNRPGTVRREQAPSPPRNQFHRPAERRSAPGAVAQRPSRPQRSVEAQRPSRDRSDDRRQRSRPDDRGRPQRVR